MSPCARDQDVIGISSHPPLFDEAISEAAARGLLQTGLACAVIDTSTTEVIAANARLAALLGLEVCQVEGLNLLSLYDARTEPLAEAVFSGIARGILHSVQGKALWHPPDTRPVDVMGWIRVIETLPAATRALIAVVPSAAGAPAPHPLANPEASRITLGTLDHDWRFSEVSPAATARFGWEPDAYLGTALQSVVHPDDAPLLLLALGRSTVERRGVAVGLRVRSYDGVWLPVRCEAIPLCDHNPPRFAVAMWSRDAERDKSADQRAARLESHLWRIAREVAASGIGDAPAAAEAWQMDPVVREMSPRQLDVLRRLLRGERVPSIARDLYLSQSTVRNHLAAIYRRAGVHSQAELIARLLPGPGSARMAG
jgi:PAS domain S-box-containing protein